ncbi:hypothetical protein FE257_009487 [Aspergillus nanangensis]|uniref:Rad21/Rec8-like protein N-terminal domain-containing protein n=1 Tax=Aspergillus nanangensis TaxID=2582783 RepID=A0AAD4GSU6_ASPNN|nr:hypothetical protein FE257_009487 [Aspergillus nanangensis]
MFYSHEILTCPEHGVATIWLVATLGSRSITRRVNRKAILDVDVPRACDVIMDPQAPMALRLQGNLLYGVSRVYSQQCGYTLTDVQSMHDRMRTMLRAVPGAALDPTAGKARPDQLILPYDLSFMPENDLPGLGLDLSKLALSIDTYSTQQSTLLWPQTPSLSQSALSQESSGFRLDFGSEDIVMKDVVGIGSDTDIASSVHAGFYPRRIGPSSLHEDGGVLLQPDFEFDEDGNIIELGAGHHRSESRHLEASHYSSDRPVPFEWNNIDLNDPFLSHQPMITDEDIQITTQTRENTPSPEARTTARCTSHAPKTGDPELHSSDIEVKMQQTRRKPKVIASDTQTALRSTELSQMNKEYLQNMAAASKQKLRNKMVTEYKRNAAFWVSGLGIGSVGVGLGASRIPHPLHRFSGEELYDLVNPEPSPNKRKRPRPSDQDTETGSERRVRARKTLEEQIGRGDDTQGITNDEDIEIARHALSALRDDNTSQMPWNITASVQSSRNGSSAANILRGIGSISDFSSRGIMESVGSFNRGRNRLTSASPLAGRGFPFDIGGLDSLTIPGNECEDVDVLGDFDLSQYLQMELYADDTGPNMDDPGEAHTGPHRRLRGFDQKIQQTTLDQESQNFLQFLVDKSAVGHVDDADQDSARTSPVMLAAAAGSEELSFSVLLPPDTTSYAVATHGLMHILALATKGFLVVQQEPYVDVSDEDGVRYEYGEIRMRLAVV